MYHTYRILFAEFHRDVGDSVGSAVTMASTSSDAALSTPTEKPQRPHEPRKPRPIKDAAKNAERQAAYEKLHDAWKVEHTAWQAQNKLWSKAQKKANRKRPEGDSERRVAQRRQHNPNIVPDSVATFFSRWRDGDRNTYWQLGYNDRSCADILAGVDPPQSLIDFLDGGGSVDAHVQGGKFTLLQLAAEACSII